MLTLDKVVELVREKGIVMIMEAAGIEHLMQNDCNLTQLGGVFHSIKFGLVFRHGRFICYTSVGAPQHSTS